MYSAVILDDEYWITKGIEKILDWQKFKTTIDFKSTDPIETLNYINEHKPDIIFTDINMDSLSGIELMKEVRLQGIDCEFIVISGHNDFEYARKAMKYNAFYYLLKPVDKKELEDVMSDLIIHLESKIDNETNFEYMENVFVNTKISTYKELFLHFNLKIINKGFQTVIIEGSIMNKQLNNIFDSGQFVVLKLGENKRCYFVNLDYDIYNRLERYITDSECVVGISDYYEGETIPYKTFFEANCAIHNQFIYKDYKVFKYKHNQKKIYDILNHLISCFTHLNKVLPYIKNLPKYARDNKLTISDIALIYNYFSNTMGYFFESYAHQIKFEQKTFEELCLTYKDIEDLSDFLYEYNSLLFKEHIIGHDERSGDSKFDELLTYINNLYNEKLYLSDLAERFYYNQTYLSDLIKKNLGKTFTEYIFELRIKKARYLLVSTLDPISEIAVKSGYNDYCYFTKQFKKATGVTPRVYRKEHGGGYKEKG